MSEKPIVAIDGPSGVGKSTAARRLAERLGLPMLDTGAMYRAVALHVLARGIDPDDRAAVVEAAATADVTVGDDAEVQLDGEAVGERIRTPEVSEATSKISAYPEVRHRMVELQRRAGRRHGAVVEGRDIGSVVFPETPHKFFLTARPEVRAGRRHRELEEKGGPSTFDEVLDDLGRRDERDSRRSTSPLVCDESYQVVDSSELTPDEVVDVMAEAVQRCGRPPTC